MDYYTDNWAVGLCVVGLCLFTVADMNLVPIQLRVQLVEFSSCRHENSNCISRTTTVEPLVRGRPAQTPGRIPGRPTRHTVEFLRRREWLPPASSSLQEK